MRICIGSTQSRLSARNAGLFGCWIRVFYQTPKPETKDFPAAEPYTLTHELVSSTSENYAFFDTLVEAEAGDSTAT